ncbi:MAG TPA: M24 family metallopeptidase [Candidatus Saccharimonadales bacterium]|nr:M24 family metallopeptidase [Candidatus Saccharimonadales bacterium]
MTIADIDNEMETRGVNGIIVLGDTTLANPDLTYVVGGSLARGGIYFKRVRNNPLLLTSNLDIATARKYQNIKQIKTFTELGYEKLVAKYGRENAYPQLLRTVLNQLGIQGKVVIFGRSDLANGIHLADQLRKHGTKIVGENTPTILESAREIKSIEELLLIRRVGEKTSKIVNSIIESLRNFRQRRGHLYMRKRRITINTTKQLIYTALAREELIAPEGTIFASGADAADPHNPGTPHQELKLGKLIVFDIFPQSENGYWFDLTRTFVLGKANAKAVKAFNTVKEAQSVAIDSMTSSTSCKQVMMKACDVIERNGYDTLRKTYHGNPRAACSGFIHSLGHGVGLTIGERPYLSLLSTEHLRASQVVTVEPGIYIPGFGGVRIEDTVAITKKGVDILAIPQQDELEVK